MSCNTLVFNGQEYSRDEFKKLVKEGRIILPSTTSPIIAPQNEVQSTLKSIVLLRSPKVVQEWNKLQKGSISMEQFLNNSQFPKEQKALVEETYNELREKSIDDLITSLAAKYAYTVEVNTTQDNRNIYNVSDEPQDHYIPEGHYIHNGYDYYTTPNSEYRRRSMGADDSLEIATKEEYEAAKDANTLKGNSKFYANLTVPGGTNYTENEISTPDITPSIKGHAQFSTDNGIGWFRSDDKGQAVRDRAFYYDEVSRDSPELFGEEFNDEVDRRVEEQTASTGPKTRRILEVQSDLFQKGRNTDDLVYTDKDAKETFLGIYEGKDVYGFDLTGNSNKFLQLLNKEGNWIPFFIKSIVQDSAKKGYEKVLFPTGDTASKVEGHTTLEEFKRQKEANIKDLNNKEQEVRNSVAFGYDGNIYEIVDDNYQKRNSSDKVSSITLEEYNTARKARLERIAFERSRYQEELKRVETEGLAALKPIYDFYENRVGNTLRKIYGKESVERIKDEYGNEWYRVDIEPTRDRAIIAHEIDLDAKIANELDLDPQAFPNMPFKFSANKIATGKKFYTVRPQSYRMGTYRAPNGHYFNIIPEGKGPIGDYLEYKGITLEKFIHDFIGEEEVQYRHVQEFLTGKRELHVYRIERVMDMNDVIPVIEDQRFNEVYENRLALIKKIRKQLRGETDPTKLEELRSRLDSLVEQRDALIDDDTRTFAMLLQIMRSDVNIVRRILEGNSDRRSLDFAKQLIVNYERLLTKEFSDVIAELNSDDRESILTFISDLTRIADRINKHYFAIAAEEVKELTGKDVLTIEGVPVDVKDINIAAAWTYDTRTNNNEIVQAITKIVRDAGVKTNVRIHEFRQRNKEIVRALKKAGYNYDFMIQTDTSGRRTGLFVNRESAEYKSERHKASSDPRELLLFYAQNHDFTVNDAAWKQREQFLMDYYMTNNNVTLNDRDIINDTTLEDKVLQFATGMVLKTNPHIMKAIFDRIKANPKRATIGDVDFFLAFMDREGFHAEKMGDKYVHPLAKEVTAKWVDPKWTMIQKLMDTDPRKAFYNHWMENIERGRRMRRDEDKYLPWNFIPEKYKPLGMMSKGRQALHDNLGQRISNNAATIDPETGEVEKKIPLYMMNNTIAPENKSYDLGEVLEDFVRETLNYEEKSAIEEPANLMLGLLKAQKVFETTPGGAIKKDDRGRVIHKDGLSNNYIQAAHRINAQIYGETQDAELVIDNLKFYTDDARIKLTRIRKEISEINLTPDEKKIATQYSAARLPYDGVNDKIGKYVKLAAEYQSIKDGGKNFTGSKFSNSMMYFTSVKFLGLNLFAGLGELLQGFTGLFTESAGNRYFGDSDATLAMGDVIRSRTPWETPIKKKVDNVARFFDTVGEIFHESEVRVKGKLENIPFIQYKLANFGTNTAFTMALLRREKVKDVNGVEHSLWDALSFEKGVASWTKKIDIALYEDGRPTTYLVNLIHKSDEVLSLNRERKTFMDPTKVDAKMAGRIIGQFKKNWMVGMFYNRFGNRKDATLTSGMEFEGFYTTFWKNVLVFPKITDPITGEEKNDTSFRGLMSMLGNVLKYFYKYSTIGKKLGGHEANVDPMVEANLRKFMREVSWALTLWATMLILSSLNGGDDKDSLRTYLINQIVRLHRDVTTFLSPSSWTSFMKNPTPMISSLGDVYSVFDTIVRSTVLGDPFNADGDVRLFKWLEKNTPIVNQIHGLQSKFDRTVLYGSNF